MSTFWNRYDEAKPYRDKGFRWGTIALAAAVPAVGIAPINFAVDDPAWSIALVIVQLSCAAFQVVALVTSVRAHGRANKIMRSVTR